MNNLHQNITIDSDETDGQGMLSPVPSKERQETQLNKAFTMEEQVPDYSVTT